MNESDLKLLGIDLIEINRIEQIIKKHPNFFKKILGKDEFNQLKKRNFPVQSIAGNFCAKEAFLKSVGVGIGSGISLKNIQILRNEKNAPYIVLDSNNKTLEKLKSFNFLVSISHTKKYATAVVLKKCNCCKCSIFSAN